jgi:hypothetical protein
VASGDGSAAASVEVVDVVPGRWSCPCLAVIAIVAAISGTAVCSYQQPVAGGGRVVRRLGNPVGHVEEPAARSLRATSIRGSAEVYRPRLGPHSGDRVAVTPAQAGSSGAMPASGLQTEMEAGGLRIETEVVADAARSGESW